MSRGLRIIFGVVGFPSWPPPWWDEKVRHVVGVVVSVLVVLGIIALVVLLLVLLATQRVDSLG